MKKLRLNLDTVQVQSFPTMPAPLADGTVLAFVAASGDSACHGTVVCTCDFTGCCHH
jgi:hypothetical protein